MVKFRIRSLGFGLFIVIIFLSIIYASLAVGNKYWPTKKHTSLVSV